MKNPHFNYRLWACLGVACIAVILVFLIRNKNGNSVVSADIPSENAVKPLMENTPSVGLAGAADIAQNPPVPAAGTVKVPATPANAPADVVAFREWAREYFQADPEQRGALIERGQELAKAHTIAVAQMIPVNPKAAIDNAVPMVVRQDLPKEIVDLLEERVNQKGELSLIGTVPKEGAAQIQTTYLHIFKPVGGEARKAYVYGGRVAERTLTETLVNGIAATPNESKQKVVAIAESRVRTLEIGERPDKAKAKSYTCPVSGKSTALTETVSQISEEVPAFEDDTTVHFVCMGGHIGIYNLNLQTEETAAHWAKLTQRSSTAALDDNIAYEGATGGPITPLSVPTSWTTGVRKVLYMRVTFSDNYEDPISEADAYEMMRQVSDEITAMSYGRTYFQTTVTPLLVLNRTHAWYTRYEDDGNYAPYTLYDEARELAKAAGYDTDYYDLDVVRWNGTVGDFGGAASVGAKWFADKAGTKGVSLHEFGHNLGLMHSNALKTNPPSIIGPGYSFEYANYWDWMGASGEGGHFVVPTKAQLGWLPREGQALAQQSGTYRIYQADQPLFDPAKRYALRVNKDVERDYWFEFRPTHPSNLSMQNGLMVTFNKWGSGNGGDISGGSSNGPLFLDMTPGSWRPGMDDTRQDGMLVIGRTFTDPETNMSVTPIAKNATTPPSMDVTVNLGPFPGNNAPTQTLTPSTTSVATNVSVNFTSTASDADGDTLAYAWDFGDGKFSTNNSSTQSKSWSAAGHYVVRCTVSDMKGKVHTAKVLITVGTPTTYTISGKVLGPGSVPLEGVQVANQIIDIASNVYFTTNHGFRQPQATNYRSGYTDSNGDYTITGVPSGSHTLYANLYPYTITAGFTNPFTVSANTTGKNWTAAEIPTLSIAALDATAAETGDTGTFRITRSGSTAASLQVQLLSASGSATLTTDYTLSPALTVSNNAYYLTIPAGSSTLDVTLTPVNDSTSEGVETAVMTLANTVFGCRVTGSNQAIIEITDDESTLPVVRLTSVDTWASEPSNGASLLVSRTGSTAAALTVNLIYAGTASAGSDYSASSSVIIPIGQSSATLPITAINDAASEGTETINVIIRSDATYQRASDAMAVTFDLNDDDIQTVSIAATDASATEAGDPGLFTITRSGTDLSQAIIVDYSINGTAIHGKDYARLEGRATIAAGETATTIRISPYNDTIGEGNQTVTITLRSDGRYLVGSPQTATVTIADDDQPTMYIRTTVAERAEPASSSAASNTFRIQRQSTGTSVTVNYSVSGTASSGSDFTALSGSVLFASGDLTKDISVSVLSDANLENTETLTLTLTSGTGYQIAAFDNTATTVIIDADQPQIAVSAADPSSTPPSLAENASQMRFYVSRNNNPASALTVYYTMSGTATSGTDYTGAAASVTIPASAFGAYVTLTPTDDATAEGAETVTLNITANAAYGFRTPSATIQLLDNDTFAGGSPSVSFNASTSTVAENAGSLNIPVTLTGTPGAPITVRYAITGGTADFTDAALPAGTLTFNAAGTQNLSLQVKTDTVPEASETVEITLSLAYGATIGTAIHTVTITDLAKPEVFTSSPGNVLATTATLNGIAIPHGQSTSAYFEWGTTTSYGTTTASQAIGSGQTEIAVSQAISGLTAGQTYHYRLVATNASGTSYGDNRLITTSALPVVQTLVATNRTSNSARLNASVNPNSQATLVWFEWGPTSSYGNTTAQQVISSGSTAVSAYAAVSGLTAGNTYHYRAVASNASGTTYGANQIFVPSSLAVAGTLYVNTRASNSSAGSATWGSSGALLTDFTEVGNPVLENNVANSGIPGVLFDGATTAYNGPNSVADIHAGSDRTIEVWYYNPAGEVNCETLVNMGRQGNDKSLLALSAGNSYATHFWNITTSWSSVPSYGTWHHLVMVYDGATTVNYYLDGLLYETKYLSAAINTYDRGIIFGSSRTIGEANTWANFGFSGYLNTVRIHGGQLSADQVLNNYQYGPALSDAPEAFTRAATTVIDDRFTANATVEPNGLATTAWIEYGPTTSYGFQSSATAIGASSAPVDISTVVYGTSGTTYHYRVVAHNASGIVYGENLTATPGPLANAGTLHVDIKATQSGAGTTTWPNLGSLGGNFTAISTPSLTSNVVSTNVPGVLFNGTSGYYGPTSPADITGSSDRTIELWMYNPAISGVEVMVDIGRYTGATRGTYNACGSWQMHYLSGEDPAWTGGAPSAGSWHHLVYVYDGNTNIKGYVDGLLTTNVTTGGVLATTAAQISMGGLRNGTANTGLQFTSFGYSGYLNSVRIHGGQLDPTQVAKNYAAGPAVPLTPAAYTSAASSVTATSATLNGSSVPMSLATTAWFEYGTTTAYGSSTTTQSLGSGSTAVAVTKSLTGLAANTLYHYRLVAQNSAGISYGSDMTFVETVFQTYLKNNGATGSNTGTAQDYDGDGVVNLLEFAFGMNPNGGSIGQFVSSGSTLTTHGLPQLFKDTGYHARFVRIKNHSSAGITYAVQFSGDLSEWETSLATPTVVASDATHDVVSVPFPEFVNGKPARFFRVVINTVP